jgi:ADP-glucose pyrophosphorylase
VIVDTNARIPDQTVIGFDPELDRERGYTVTDTGVVVVAG